MLSDLHYIKREKIVLWGTTQSGSLIFLGVPGKLTIKKDKGAANMLSAKLKVDEKKERLIKIKAECGTKVIFEGIPDEEIYTESALGTYLEIIARCNISLLLDNEVMPQEIKNPSLSFFSKRFLEPYGFKIKSNTEKAFGKIKASKGMSVLSFLNSFLKSAYETSPVIKSDGSVYLLSEYTPENVRIREDKLIKMETARKTSDIISEYIFPDFITGAYTKSISNKNANGIIRKKYRDEAKLLDFTIYNNVKLTLEGFVDCEVYDKVASLGEEGLIESIRYERKAEGDYTLIEFKSREEV